MAIDIRDIKVDVSSFGDTFILTDIVPIYEYKDDTRTDNIEGYRYIVAVPKMKFEKMGVKIESDEPLIDLKDLYDSDGIMVTFENLRIGLYQDFRTKDVGVVAVADGISRIE